MIQKHPKRMIILLFIVNLFTDKEFYLHAKSNMNHKHNKNVYFLRIYVLNVIWSIKRKKSNKITIFIWSKRTKPLVMLAIKVHYLEISNCGLKYIHRERQWESTHYKVTTLRNQYYSLCHCINLWTVNTFCFNVQVQCY